MKDSRPEIDGPNAKPKPVKNATGKDICTYVLVLGPTRVGCERDFKHNAGKTEAETQHHGNGWRWSTVGANLGVQKRRECPADDPCRLPTRLE